MMRTANSEQPAPGAAPSKAVAESIPSQTPWARFGAMTVQGFGGALRAFAVLGLVGCLCLAFATDAWAQPSAALSQKSSEADEIAAVARDEGYVPVIVMFDPPANGALAADAPSEAEGTALIRATQDLIIERHFGETPALQSGEGFDRNLTRYRFTPGFAVSVTLSELQDLAADPLVTHIQYDRPVRVDLDDSVPLIGMENAYLRGGTGSAYAVVVLDNGFQTNHEFLNSPFRVIAEACFSFAGGSAGYISLCPNGGVTQTGPGSASALTAQCFDGTENMCSHGTHVAGIAAGFNTAKNLGEPANGVAKEGRIWAIQVFARTNSADDCAPKEAPCLESSFSRINSALEYVYANLNNLPLLTRVAAINMSLGDDVGRTGACDDHLLKPMIDKLRARGVLTVVSSGNEGFRNALSAPACISSALTVGAARKDDQISSFTSMGSLVDLMAPGTSIESSVPGPRATPPGTSAYEPDSGTSMAAPHVSGAIAAFFSGCPNLWTYTGSTSDAIENALKVTGLPIEDTRSDGVHTKNRIRVDLAMMALNCGPPPNDNFINAFSLSPGMGYVARNNNATKEPGEPRHADRTGGRSVWWDFVTPSAGEVTISTAFSNFDTLLAVYTGGSVSSLTEVAANDDFGGFQSQVTFDAAPFTVYRVAVDGFNGANGNIQLSVSQSMTLAVNASPAAGGSVSGGGTYPAGSMRTVTATPNPGYSFIAWTENGSAVSLTQSYTFFLDRDRSLVALFDPDPATFTVSVSASPMAGGGVSGGGTYEEGTMRTVVAAANAGWRFVNWTEGGSEVSTDASYTFTLDGDRDLVANFVEQPILSVTPASQLVGSGATSTLFSVSNTGGGSFTYSASDDAGWLAITSGASGTDSGTINVSVDANPGAQRTGHVTVTADGASDSPKTVSVVQAAAPAPPNDNFANASTIQSGQTLSAANANATKESGEPNHAGNAGGKSLWWKFTAPSTGRATVSTAGSSFNTLLGVYTGGAVNALSAVASNNDHDGTLQSQVSFNAVGGTTYRIAVDGSNAASGNIQLSVTQQALTSLPWLMLLLE